MSKISVMPDGSTHLWDEKTDSYEGMYEDTKYTIVKDERTNGFFALYMWDLWDNEVAAHSCGVTKFRSYKGTLKFMKEVVDDYLTFEA